METAAPKGQRWAFKSEGSSPALTLRKGKPTPMSTLPLEVQELPYLRGALQQALTCLFPRQAQEQPFIQQTMENFIIS